MYVVITDKYKSGELGNKKYFLEKRLTELQMIKTKE